MDHIDPFLGWITNFDKEFRTNLNDFSGSKKTVEVQPSVTMFIRNTNNGEIISQHYEGEK